MGSISPLIALPFPITDRQLTASLAIKTELGRVFSPEGIVKGDTLHQSGQRLRRWLVGEGIITW